MGGVADCDVLRLVDDSVEGLMRLHAEGGDGEEDEEQGGKSHILEGKEKTNKQMLISQQYNSVKQKEN